MTVIRRLPPHLVNRIAAGEVVERPASVVKELVENALDAGATRIDIQVGQGGRSLRIADNGHGMSRENVLLAFENHATSKLSPDDDLTTILTLGFRGEALASISAISRLTCETRCIDHPHGTRIVIEGGSPATVTDCGCAIGTVMTIDDLFFNTPARLKFLKRPATELAAIEEAVQLLALSHPQVRLTLTLAGKVVLETPGTGQMPDVLAAVLGQTIPTGAVVEAHWEDPVQQATVTAWLATPAATAFHYRSRRAWWQLVNRRGIKCPLLGKAMEAGYQGLIPDRTYPLCLVHVNLPPQAVDINVHPAKREVRYQHPSEVFSLVRHTLRHALEQHFRPVYGLGGNLPSPITSPAEQETVSFFAPGFEPTEATGEPSSPVFSSRINSGGAASHHSSGRLPLAVSQQALALYQPPFNSAATSPEFAQTPALTNNWRIIGQLFNTYILLETAKGLMVVDQHIASERLGYERLMHQLSGEASVIQRLAVPLDLGWSPAQQALIELHQQALAQLGFEFEQDDVAGHNRWKLLSQPLVYPDRTQLSAQQQVTHLLAQLEGTGQAQPDWEQLASTLACHTAVRAGDRLTLEQMKTVIDGWLTCQLPWSCPHGRPIAHTIDVTELNNFFERPSLPVNSGFSGHSR